MALICAADMTARSASSRHARIPCIAGLALLGLMVTIVGRVIHELLIGEPAGEDSV